ncbi:MAG: TspO/MBR family protein [Alphaproteobacteria bacterium]
METSNFLTLLPFLLACAAAASTGIYFRPEEWYRDLNKPSWRPPDWLFGPVWLVLYIMIAVAGWRIWNIAGWEVGAAALTVYGVQLALNALWSGIFFGLRRIGLAVLEIGGLWLAIAATIALFWPIDRTAAYLLVPYLMWASFAGVLNLTIWRLNRANMT